MAAPCSMLLKHAFYSLGFDSGACKKVFQLGDLSQNPPWFLMHFNSGFASLIKNEIQGLFQKFQKTFLV